MLISPELAARLVVTGRARAAQWPDEAQVAARTLALYDNLAKTD